MIIYYNGRFIPAEAAAIAPVDHSFLYGHGLFETMRVYAGRIFMFEDHFCRLQAGANLLGWPELPSQGELTSAIYQVLEYNQLHNASVRLTLSRGSGASRPDPASCGALTLVVFASPLPPPVAATGWNIVTVNLRRNLYSPLVRIKSANYLDNILAKAEAKKKGAQEAVMLNSDGFVAEGSMSNIFHVKGGTLVTPDEHSGILPGITRKTILDLAQANGIPVEIRKVEREELVDADEIFLTSSIMEIIPVRAMDGHNVSSRSPTPGPVTADLLNLYRKLTEKK